MMARTALLALVFLAGVAACSATPGIRWIRFAGSDDPEPSCLTFTDEDSCLAHACGWCSSSGVLDDVFQGCLSESFAKLVPQSLAACKLSDEPADDDDDDDEDEEGLAQALDKKHKPKPKPKKAPASCGDNKEKHDCLHLGAEEGECAWCEGGFMPPSCLATMAAKWLPEQVAKCKMPKKHKKDDEVEETDSLAEDGPSSDDPDKPKPKATSCGDNKEKRDCLDLGAEEGDCAWCKGDFMPASCVGVKAAEWIPEQVAKCKMPKKHKKEDVEDANAANKRAASCMDIKDDRECVRRGAEEGECAWCAGSSFLPSACVGVDKAKYIPEQVATCKLPKHADTDSLAAAAALGKKRHSKKHHSDSGKGGGGWGPSGGDWPSGGGDWPSGGGGDYPGPGGGGQGQGCMALKSKKKCLKGTDTEACAWCGTSSFLGSPCVSESTAKYIPSFMSKCKMGKGPKRNDAADKVAVA